MTELINYKAVSRLLTGNESSIRRNACAKKHLAKVRRLEQLVEQWTRELDQV